jgi:hypothetical protein
VTLLILNVRLQAKALNVCECCCRYSTTLNQTIAADMILPTPYTCGWDQLSCTFNASLATYANGVYLADTSGRVTRDPSQCLLDPLNNCTPALAFWPDFFMLPVLMLMLITLLNDGTLISIGYDTVRPSATPERWNLPVLLISACVHGVVACSSSLLLLWGGLDSNNPDGLFAGLGIPPLEYGKIVTMIYLKVI